MVIPVTVEFDSSGKLMNAIEEYTSPKAISPAGNRVSVEISGLEEQYWAAPSIQGSSFSLKIDKTLIKNGLKSAKFTVLVTDLSTQA